MFEDLDEIQHVQLFLTSLLADRVHRRPQEIGVGDAANGHGVLKSDKQTVTRTLLGREIHQILSQIRGRAFGHLKGRMPREHLGERTLARAVGTHDGVHLTRVDRQVDAAKDLFTVYRRVQVLYFEQCHSLVLRLDFSGAIDQPTLPSSVTPRSFCASTANSMGSSRKTSLQNPFTMSETASSADSPRCWQ